MTYACLVCGESVQVGINSPSCVICDKCKSAILKIRRQEEYNVPKTYLIKMYDELGNGFYISKAPKMATTSSTESKIKVLKEEVVKNMYLFDCNKDNALFFTRTKANKICKSFYLLQKNGFFNQFIKAEILKDNNVVFNWDFKKKEC